ncbi:hypothetical protein B0H10DRAFT_1375369 [Mycena sp. CBHHK59/15]|nr:hypothetical protein B0H10DRAFT_1375369 [Mycena sp. CBHHK59/15]
MLPIATSSACGTCHFLPLFPPFVSIHRFYRSTYEAVIFLLPTFLRYLAPDLANEISPPVRCAVSGRAYAAASGHSFHYLSALLLEVIPSLVDRTDTSHRARTRLPSVHTSARGLAPILGRSPATQNPPPAPPTAHAGASRSTYAVAHLGQKSVAMVPSMVGPALEVRLRARGREGGRLCVRVAHVALPARVVVGAGVGSAESGGAVGQGWT